MFDAPGASISQVDGSFDVYSVTFGASSPGHTITAFDVASKLTLRGGLTNLSTFGQVVGVDLVLGANQTWEAANGDFLISGTLDNNGFNLTVGGGNNTEISGAISGTGSLIKSGAGELTLSGANLFTGAAVVQSGTLVLDAPGGQNAIRGALSVGDGVGSPNTASVRLGAVFDNVASDQIPDGSAVNIFRDGRLDLNGRIEQIGPLNMQSGLIQTGAGRLILAGDANFGSGLGPAILLGNLELVGTRVFNVADDPILEDLAVGALVSGGALVKTGPGGMSLSRANTFSGGFTLEDGTVLISHDQALGTGLFTVRGGAVRADAAPRTVANDVRLDGNLTMAGAFDLEFSGNVTLTADRQITVNSTKPLIFSGAIGELGGVHGLIKEGTGPMRLTGANTFRGAVTINGGTIEAAGAGAMSLVSGVHINAGSTLAFGGSLSADRVGDGVGLFLNGGTINSGSATEKAGLLTLNGDSILQLNLDGISGAFTVDGISWVNGVLTIKGWNGQAGESGLDDRFISVTDPGLDLLSRINFEGFNPGSLWMAGEIVPFATVVPEPGSVGLIFLGVGGWLLRRRFRGV